MPWNSPWLHVQNCHKRGKGYYQVDIDIPGVSVYCLCQACSRGRKWVPLVRKCCPVWSWSCSSALLKNSCQTCCLTWRHCAWILTCFWMTRKCGILGNFFFSFPVSYIDSLNKFLKARKSVGLVVVDHII